MRDPRGFQRRGGKARRQCGDHHSQWKCLLPPQQKRRRAKRRRRNGCHPGDGLASGGEIQRNPGAERDRNPRQQSAGARFGAGPALQLYDEGRPCANAWRS
jgi:hypothetical protein